MTSDSSGEADIVVEGSAVRALGRFLTGLEAKGVADRLDQGLTLPQSLMGVGQTRRSPARERIEAAGLKSDLRTLAAVLRAIEGSRNVVSRIVPYWTLPGHLASSGGLTSSVAHLVLNATQSVTCSTFNFQQSSELWDALRTVADRPQVRVRVYVDTAAAKPRATWVPPTIKEVAAHLRPAKVFRTRTVDGKLVRNHAKFVAVDHRFLLVTSANFSHSAEFANVELGLAVDNATLAQSVEQQLLDIEPVVYKRVVAQPTTPGG